MSSSVLVHVDYANGGISGSYISSTIGCLTDYRNVLFCHSGFSHNLKSTKVYRVFDRFSKYFPGAKPKLFSRYLELYLSLALVLFYCGARKLFFGEKLYIFLQLHQSFIHYYLFCRLASSFSCLTITVHDADELKHNYPARLMVDRKKILNLADNIIVHGGESIEKLKVFSDSIYEYPFPLYDASALSKKIELRLARGKSPIKFLFVGHLRKEKGVERLINSWGELDDDTVSRASLTIAGKTAFGENVELHDFDGITYNLGFIGDEEFRNLIFQADYVLLPYEGGTNSGVLSDCAAELCPCICSNIPLFSDSLFVLPDLIFDDGVGLTHLLGVLINSSEIDYADYVQRVFDRLYKYEDIYLGRCRFVFSEILSN